MIREKFKTYVRKKFITLFKIINYNLLVITVFCNYTYSSVGNKFYDPTLRPLDYHKHAVGHNNINFSEYVVYMIVTTEKYKSALINDKMYTQGQMLNANLKIIRIGKNCVFLSNGKNICVREYSKKIHITGAN